MSNIIKMTNYNLNKKRMNPTKNKNLVFEIRKNLVSHTTMTRA